MLVEVVCVVTANGIEHAVGAPVDRHQKPVADDHVEPLAGIVSAAGSSAHERELQKPIRPSQPGRRRGRTRGVVVHQLANIHPRIGCGGKGRVDEAPLDHSRVDVDPDKPAAIDLPANLGQAEAAPLTITKIEELGANPGWPETCFVIGRICIGDGADHHGKAAGRLKQSTSKTRRAHPGHSREASTGRFCPSMPRSLRPRNLKIPLP